jgi:hypothetical protein
MTERLTIAYILIALLIAGAVFTVARIRYMSSESVRRREKKRRGF